MPALYLWPWHPISPSTCLGDASVKVMPKDCRSHNQEDGERLRLSLPSACQDQHVPELRTKLLGGRGASFYIVGRHCRLVAALDQLLLKETGAKLTLSETLLFPTRSSVYPTHTP